ncbi:hypothetical protein MVEN_01445300 [Mycena venus]|uniref:Uncharacterized protein n=1 Tax=Mycena venus TaxID=2733690 RepID=A0A8H7CQX3_9AGAR|nr:hypothetical protein MVEN_01445300 [Mycena venus]
MNHHPNSEPVPLFASAAASANFHSVSLASGLTTNPYDSAPPVPLFRRNPAANDPFQSTNSYDTFFGSLRTGTSTLTQNNPLHSLTSSTRSGDIRPTIDHILNQPPPTGHHLFSSHATSDPSVPAPRRDFSAYKSQLPTLGQFTTSDNFVTSFQTRTPKRKERTPGMPLETPSPTGAPPKRRKPALDTSEKLKKIFALLKDLDWTIGEFFHHLFSHKDEDNIPISRSQSHGLIVQNFLAGKTNYTVSDIINLWMTSPYGSGHDERMFETETSYLDIRPVRQALTAFAVQASADYLGSESKTAVKPASGLHAVIETNADLQDEEEETTIQWMDLGNAVPRAAAHFREIQRVAFHFLNVMAEPTPRSRNGVITIPKSRPRENVVAHCLSILDFCKNDRARILPLCRGVLYLASCVPVDIIAINSRLGTMPSVNTIKSALKGFSQQKAIAIRTRARDVSVIKDSKCRLRTLLNILIFDNVQHFLRQ